MNQAKLQLIARVALAFMWLLTTATSCWWGRDIGYAVLSLRHIEGGFADLCIDAGSILDALMGIWVLSGWQLRQCYRAQILVIVTYSLLLTFIAPTFWLHPFGPLTKNIPILALLLLLNQLEVNNTGTAAKR